VLTLLKIGSFPRKKDATGRLSKYGVPMTKKKKGRVRVPYSKDDVRKLKAHSRARTPLKKIAEELKRTEGSLRQKALALGIGLGHQR
jgi:hypothetical protein